MTLPPLDWTARELGPGILAGARLGDWWRILRENRFDVDARYLPRVVHVTGAALVNSVAARVQDRRRAAREGGIAIADPVFVLGLWRSGTTLLHTLLARDPGFASLSLYEALNPHTFRLAAGPRSTLLDLLVPRRRAMDAMAQGAREPVEEDVALATLGLSGMLGLAFPRRLAHYWRYVDLTALADTERARWRDAYRRLVEDLTLAHGRRLVLKSPANTARIPALRELFPDARFVTVHRHPEAVLRSARHALRETSRGWRVHAAAFDDRWMVEAFGGVLDRYFEDRTSVPEGRLYEIAYSDLIADARGTIERIYEALELDHSDAARSARCADLDRIAEHPRRVHADLDGATRELLRRRWSRAYRAWDYAPLAGPRD